VSAGRAIAAAHVTAAQAQAKVNPAAADLQAFLTAGGCVCLDRVELCDVGTALGHKILRKRYVFNVFSKLLTGSGVGPAGQLLTYQE
jgi:hypothetical protein